MWKAFIGAFSRDNYLNFTGRSTRFEFWSFLGLFVLCSWLLNVTLLELMLVSEHPLVTQLAYWVPLIWGVFTVIPSLAITVRRVRDAGFSGWWVLALSLAQGLVGYWLDRVDSMVVLCALVFASFAILVMWLYLLCRKSVSVS